MDSKTSSSVCSKICCRVKKINNPRPPNLFEMSSTEQSIIKIQKDPTLRKIHFLRNFEYNSTESPGSFDKECGKPSPKRQNSHVITMLFYMLNMVWIEHCRKFERFFNVLDMNKFDEFEKMNSEKYSKIKWNIKVDCKTRDFCYQIIRLKLKYFLYAMADRMLPKYASRSKFYSSDHSKLLERPQFTLMEVGPLVYLISETISLQTRRKYTISLNFKYHNFCNDNGLQEKIDRKRREINDKLKYLNKNRQKKGNSPERDIVQTVVYEPLSEKTVTLFRVTGLESFNIFVRKSKYADQGHEFKWFKYNPKFYQESYFKVAKVYLSRTWLYENELKIIDFLQKTLSCFITKIFFRGFQLKHKFNFLHIFLVNEWSQNDFLRRTRGDNIIFLNFWALGISDMKTTVQHKKDSNLSWKQMAKTEKDLLSLDFPKFISCIHYMWEIARALVELREAAIHKQSVCEVKIFQESKTTFWEILRGEFKIDPNLETIFNEINLKRFVLERMMNFKDVKFKHLFIKTEEFENYLDHHEFLQKSDPPFLRENETDFTRYEKPYVDWMINQKNVKKSDHSIFELKVFDEDSLSSEPHRYERFLLYQRLLLLASTLARIMKYKMYLRSTLMKLLKGLIFQHKKSKYAVSDLIEYMKKHVFETNLYLEKNQNYINNTKIKCLSLIFRHFELNYKNQCGYRRYNFFKEIKKNLD